MASTAMISIGDYPFTLSYITYDPEKVDAILHEKMAAAVAHLAPALRQEVECAHRTIVRSPAKHFRNRVRFGVHLSADGKLSYVMWEGGAANVVVEAFPIAAACICAAMAPVLRFVESEPELLAADLRAVHFLSTLTEQLLITLIYERPSIDEDKWRVAAMSLRDHVAAALPATASVVGVIGRSKNTCLVEGCNRVTEALHLADGRTVTYVQVEDGFSNPNAAVNQGALDWICSAVQLATSSSSGGAQDFLELYCGNGNHTCAIAAFARRVVAVELNKALCEAAEENLRANGVSNVLVVPCDSEHFASRILRAKQYVHRPKRNVAVGPQPPPLPHKPADDTAPAPLPAPATQDGDSNDEVVYDFCAVLVDPPRAGLDPKSRRLVATYDAIIYISCSPESLARDLLELQDTHTVVRYAVFDQFAYSNGHLEQGVYLARKKNNDGDVG
jgi:tRNA (uracil-5-)-methyltransferase